MARRSKSKDSTKESLSNSSKKEHVHDQEEEDEEKLKAVARPVGSDEDKNATATVDAIGEELDKDEKFKPSPHGCNFFQWIDPPLNEHYRSTLWKLKNEVDFKSTEVERLKKKVLKLTLRVADEEKAKLQLMEVMGEVQKLKSQLKWNLMFVIGSVVVFCLHLIML